MLSRFSLALAILAAGASALAQVAPRPPIALDWQAPAECPDGSQVLEEIGRLLGTEAPLPSAPVSVRAAVSRVGDSWSIELVTKIGDSAGERSFTADTCQRLGEAAALVVALAIRPAPPPEPPTPPAPAAPTPPPAAPRALALRPLIAADLGVLAKPGLSAGAAVGLIAGDLRFELQLARGLSQRTAFASKADASLDLQIPISAEILGCWALNQGALEVSGCAGFQGSQLRGAAAGISDPGAGRSWWLGALGGAALGWRLWDPVALRLEADLGLALVRPSFVVEPFGEVHRPSLLFGRVGLGVELRL